MAGPGQSWARRHTPQGAWGFQGSHPRISQLKTPHYPTHGCKSFPGVRLLHGASTDWNGLFPPFPILTRLYRAVLGPFSPKFPGLKVADTMSITTTELTDHQALAVKIRDENPSIGWQDLADEMTRVTGTTIRKGSARGAYLAGEKKLRAQTGGEALAVRLDRACEVYMAGIAEVADEDLAAAARLQAIRILWYLKNNPEVMSRSSGKDLTTMFGMLIDKSQLLRGEPTQITRLEDVKKLDELGAMLEAEMRRRGKIIDVTPEAA